MEFTKMNVDKIAVFEEVSSGFVPIINSYINDGFIVYFLSIEDKVRTQKNIQKNLETKRLVDLSQMIFDHLLYYRAACYAHKNLDQVFNKYFSNSRLIKITCDLFKSHEIENMYKKELLNNLQKIYEIELKINEIAGDNPEEVYFYPARNFNIYSDALSLLNKNVSLVKHKNIRNKIKNIYGKFSDIGLILVYPIYFFLKKTKRISIGKKTPKRFIIGLNVNLPSLFGYNYHYINYIVDDIYRFPRNEILFINNGINEPGFRHECNKRSYSYADSMQKETISLNLFLNKFIITFSPAWIKCFFYSFSEEKFILGVTRNILADYIKWNVFVDCYSIKNYITLLLPDNISKNLVLSSNSIKTWYILPDNYAADYHTGWDEAQHATILFYFMNYDYAILYGDKIKRYLNYNKNNIKNYVTVGVLSSQRVHELQDGKLTSKLPSILKNKNLPQKIIGVFDTTFADWGVMKTKDGIRFGEDIMRLLNEIPDIGVIFKEKKFRSYNPQLIPVYEKLEKHERCMVIRKTETDCIFTPEVIALSDFVISAAYTSTTAEALGARKKAIYYDVAGTDIGDNYYFNKFPNLVAHNYEELIKLVNYWLYEVTDEKFENFLNTYVKGEIDPYLDGKAIDRLQALLITD